MRCSAPKGKASRIGSKTLPVFHLALVTAARNLQRPVHFRKGMNTVGRYNFGIDYRLWCLVTAKNLPMMIHTLAETGYDAHTGNPYFVVVCCHVFVPVD